MSAKAVLEAVFRDAISGVSPAERVTACLREHGASGDAITLLAVGKAARAMACGALEVLGSRVVRGVVVAPAPCSVPAPLSLMVAAHPMPDERSVAAARVLVGLAALPADTVVVLVSGGASALAALPADGVTLADKVAATSAVYRAGAPIDELNIVRKHLSALKGGRLAAASRAHVLTLVASDVVGDDLGAVGSGPTIPDPSTFADAIRIVERWSGWAAIPDAIREHLEAGARGERRDTPARARPGDDARLACGIGTLVAEAATAAERRGLSPVACDPPVTGPVRSVADRIEARVRGARGAGARCFVFGGEATIEVATPCGVGGRAHHLALLLAARFRDEVGVTALVCGSDGIDGNSPAAGGIVDGRTWAAITAAWGEPTRAIAGCDSFTALAAVGASLSTGPTGVNHADLVLVHTDAGW